MTRAPDRPVLVELVGPPGAGKSSVFEVLAATDSTIEPRPAIDWRADAPRVARHIAAVLATYAWHRTLRAPRGTSLRETVYLRAVPELVRGGHRGRTIVFDQGPVYLLSRPGLLEPRFARWWIRTADTWAAHLDVVVWLDAPDDVLMTRINARDTSHRIKGVELDAVRSFLTAGRAATSRVMAQLADAERRPTIMQVDTSTRTAAEVAAMVLDAVAGCRVAG